MAVVIEKKDSMLIITLPKNYDFFVEEEIVGFIKESENFQGIRNIIIDCTALELLESFGGEFFKLKEKITEPKSGKMVFVGLQQNIKFIFDEFSKRWFDEEVNNFTSIEKAVAYIGV